MNRILSWTSRLFILLREEFLPYMSNRKKKSIIVQFRDGIALYREYGVFPYHYFKHRLYEADSPECIGYVPGVLVKRFQEYANPISHLENLSDKSKTQICLSNANIPVVPDLFVVNESGEFTKNGEKITYIEARKLMQEFQGQVFAKPISGGRGSGTMLISHSEKSELDFSNLRDYVFQPQILNHPSLNVIHASCLNTMRIDTLVVGKECFINAVVIRFGRGISIADNYGLGGIGVGVDTETGALLSSGVTKARFIREKFDSHPDSGITFKGFEVPFFQEALSLAIRSSFALSPLRSFAWDIAITQDGPLVVEGNETGDFFFLQEACGPLSASELAQHSIRLHKLSV
jgi:hypothetical protein